MKLVVHQRAGDVRLGMLRDDVRQLLGPPVQVRERCDFFDEGCLHVHYSQMQEVELVVVAAGREAEFEGRDLLSMAASEAVAYVSGYGAVDTSDPEYPTTATFRSLDLNLWRSALPEESGDPAHERFEAVGVGRRGYFSRDAVD